MKLIEVYPTDLWSGGGAPIGGGRRTGGRCSAGRRSRLFPELVAHDPAGPGQTDQLAALSVGQCTRLRAV